jgi:hypothetical protein
MARGRDRDRLMEARICCSWGERTMGFVGRPLGMGLLLSLEGVMRKSLSRVA